MLGNAEAMPCASGSFDAYTIAFGIRNVTHIEKALAEAYRVLKIGGRFMCLEFSHPTTITLDKLYDWYSFNVIPTLGEKLAADRDSYQYLVESIRKFPKQEQFMAMIQKAGFENVSYTNLSGGIVAIHSGWKL
jgi:demethylmenaquinone methyltransferase/2-methoxy-6-polyprenyl-1,4-benzoquinol methylase